MSNIEEIKLNDNITIHRSQYNWRYPKDILINRVKQNLSHASLSDFTTSNFVIQSKEINSLKSYCRDLAIQVLGHTFDSLSNYVEQHWIYASNRNTNINLGEAEIFHNHLITITTSNSVPIPNIKTDISYCVYLNVPSDLNGEDGKLVFKDKNGEEVSILPRTGDILFFNPTYLHKPNFIHHSKEERIAVCSNLTINLSEYSEKKILI